MLPTTVITRGISRKSRLVVYDNQSADILDNKGSVPKDRSLSVIIRVAPSNSSINRYFDFFFNEALINLARIFLKKGESSRMIPSILSYPILTVYIGSTY